MGINDIFEGGEFPLRPDHPDFWRLSEIILQMDGAMGAATTDDERDDAWARFIDEKIFGKALYYMAFQRAARSLGITTVGEAQENVAMLTRMTVLYSEAFAVGVAFTERGGRQQ